MSHFSPYRWDLPPAVELKRELEDSDILPKCEFNINSIKRIWFKPWEKRETVHRCEEIARWVVIVEVDFCTNNEDNPHDHIIWCCDEHKDHFDHIRVQNFNCPSLPEPTKDYRVTQVEKL